VLLFQFDQGQSNPTYKIVAQDGKRFVLRKKPPQASHAKGTHRIEHEYHIMQALQKTDVPVPRVVKLCEDRSVLGEAFYIMEFVEGRIFEDPAMIGVAPEERRSL
jgi:aminoglycoside phosphotransferase (APT) family kinase protein